MTIAAIGSVHTRTVLEWYTLGGEHGELTIVQVVRVIEHRGDRWLTVEVIDTDSPTGFMLGARRLAHVSTLTPA